MSAAASFEVAMFFHPPETTCSKHRVAMVYDRVDRSGAIVGIEDLGKWAKATEERRDRTLRRQVVKRRERMMDIRSTRIGRFSWARAQREVRARLLLRWQRLLHAQISN